MTVPPEPEKRKEINVSAIKCLCLWKKGGMIRMQADPSCPVTFHSDQVNEVFEELNMSSDLLDEHHNNPLGE